ncbi:MFS transporter [Microbacterium petrolearium]|jgi:MFS family permease
MPSDADLARIQRRTVATLAGGQILGGLAFGSTVSLGALLAADISGSEGFSGLAVASSTLGSALLAIPLARSAASRGRRIALTTGMVLALVGVLVVIVATGLRWFPLLLLGFALTGAGQTVNLQSRFAATDLAADATRGRDLSLVVWATTVGSVAGPNLLGAGEWIGQRIGMPELTGPFLFSVVAQALVVALYLVALRPDPLLLARERDAARPATLAEHPDRPRVARYAIFAVAGSHGVMAAVMSMTPVHLEHHGASLQIVGLTISLHVAGMYALSPVFGILADRLGRVPTILGGQAILVASLLLASFGQDDQALVTVALVLLGLGWSASTVAGSALLAEATAPPLRTRRQGRSDLAMSLVGSVGAIAAGGILALIGYGGLALVALVVVAAIVLLAPAGRAR